MDTVKPNAPNTIKARMIRTDQGCFISDCFASGGYDYNYHQGKIQYLYFDDEQPVPSFKKNWLVIKQFPMKIQRKISGERINQRWEIRDKDMVSAKLPDTIVYGDNHFLDEDGCFIYSGFYDLKFDLSPDKMEDVSVEWDYVLDVDNFEKPPEIRFEGMHKYDYRDVPYIVDNSYVTHQALDEMIFPEVLLHNRPCKLDSTTVYNITRRYVLEHIDNSVTKITSNYDFCFAVAKLIPKTAPESITYQNIFARTKREREKLHTTIKKYEEHQIFEMTTEKERYRGYTPIPSMTANSENELNQKMQNWLEWLMEAINKPLCECPHCNGVGFFVDTGKLKANYVEEQTQ